MLLAAAVAAAGCASGGLPFEQPDSAIGPSDAPGPADAPLETFPDAPADAMPDAPPVVMPDAMPDAPPPCTPMEIEKLTNPALDLEPKGTGWTEIPIAGLPDVITSEGTAVHSAPYKAWLGGVVNENATVTDQVYQDITFPADTTQVVLTGFYVVSTQEFFNIPFDTFTIGLTETNGTPIETALNLSNVNAVGAWTAFSKTFTANLAGRTVRLRATSTHDTSLVTSFLIDTLSLKATHCP